MSAPDPQPQKPLPPTTPLPPGGYNDSADQAAEEWANANVADTNNDHRERGAIILFDGVIYDVSQTFVGEEGTCWQEFVFNYLLYALACLNSNYTMEGFVHIHSAYPPNATRSTWNTWDYGPSGADYFLFNLPGIKNQYIMNEKENFYQFFRGIPVDLDAIN